MSEVNFHEESKRGFGVINGGLLLGWMILTLSFALFPAGLGAFVDVAALG